MAHYHNRFKKKEALIVLGIFALFLLCVLLADTADAFRRRFRSSLRSTLTPLWSFTDTLA